MLAGTCVRSQAVLLVAAALCFLYQARVATASFSSGISLSPSLGAWTLSYADFDNDGKLDLLVGRAATPTAVWLRNNGTAFDPSPRTVTNISGGLTAMTVGFIDNDNALDVVMCTIAGGLVWTQGDTSSAGFSVTHVVNPSMSRCNALALGDLTGSGSLDIVVATDNSVFALLNNGMGDFGSPVHLLANQSIRCLSIANFTGTAHRDILVTHDTAPYGMRLLRNDGGGQFTQLPLQTSGKRVLALEHGDFRGIGIEDIVFVVESEGLYQSLNDGTGTFNSWLVFGTSVQGTRGYLAVADIDGDGYLDAAISTDFVQIIRNVGGRLTSSTDDLFTTSDAFGIVLFDTQARGVMDVIVGTGSLSLFLNQDTSPLVASPVTINGGSAGTSMAVGDLGHGRQDIVVGGTGPLALIYNHAPQTHSLYTFTPDLSDFSTQLLHNYTNVAAVQLCEIAGTGRLDIVFADFTGVHWLRNEGVQADGHVGFTLMPRLISLALTALECGDLDNSGSVDVVALGFGTHENSTFLFLNDGNGVFTTYKVPTEVPAGNQLLSVAVADFNGDGHLDLVVGSAAGVLLLLQTDADRLWYTQQWVQRDLSANDLLAVDFNLDGMMDLIYTGTQTNEIELASNLGNASRFTFQRRSSGTSSPSILASGDLNSDGWLDVCVLGSGVTTVCIINSHGLLGQSDAVALPFQLGSGGGALIVTDVNGDGLVDVVASDIVKQQTLLAMNTARLVEVSLDKWLQPDSAWPIYTAPPVLAQRPLQPHLNPYTRFPAPTSIILKYDTAPAPHTPPPRFLLHAAWRVGATPTRAGSQVTVVLPREGVHIECCSRGHQCTAVGSSASLVVTGGALQWVGCSKHPHPLTARYALNVSGARVTFVYSQLCSKLSSPSRLGFCSSKAPVYRASWPNPAFPRPTTPALPTGTPSPFLLFLNLTNYGGGILLQDTSFQAIGPATARVGLIEHGNMGWEGAGGGILARTSTLILRRWSFSHCRAMNGGGLALSNSDALLDHTDFTLCSATSVGGALYSVGNSVVEMAHMQFTSNSALTGGGMYLASKTNAQHFMVDVVAKFNFADTDGGFMFLAQCGVAIDLSTLHGNAAVNGAGGGVRVFQGATLTMVGCEMSRNYASDRGGAVSSFQGVVGLTNMLLVDNSATDGGAVHVISSGLTLNQANLTGNKAADYGGAIFCEGFPDSKASIDLQSINVTGNRAVVGAGMHSQLCQGLVVSSTFSFNEAKVIPHVSTLLRGLGGGLSLQSTQIGGIVIDFSDIFVLNNTAEHNGGGIYIDMLAPGELSQTFGVVEHNRAERGGGGGLYYAVGVAYSTPQLRVQNNRAVYGSDIASSAIQLLMVLDEVERTDQQSGVPFVGPLLVSLHDAFGAVVSTDSHTFVTLSSAHRNITVLQTGATTAQRGGIDLTGSFALLVPQPNATYFLHWAVVGPAQRTTTIFPTPLRVFIAPCPAGTRWNAVSRRCVPCAAGTYSAVSGASGCEDCQPGYYSAADGATACHTCTQPLYSQHARSTVCSECAPGLHWVDSRHPCAPCSGDQLAVGAVCLCPALSVRVVESATVSCIQCSSIDGALCPSNVTNLAPSQVEAVPGYWRVPDQLRFLNCPFPASCGPRGCQGSAQGPCCMRCGPNTYRSITGTCTTCPSGGAASVAALTVAFVVVVLFIVVLYMHVMRVEWDIVETSATSVATPAKRLSIHEVDEYDVSPNNLVGVPDMDQPSPQQRRRQTLAVPRRSDAYRLNSLFKIVVGHVQILVLILAAGGGYQANEDDGHGIPGQLRHFAVYLGVGVLRVFRVVPLTCLTSSPFAVNIVITLLLPLVLALLVVVAGVICYFLRRHWWRQPLTPREIRRRGVKALCVLLVIIFPLTTAELLETFYHTKCGSYLNAVGVDAGLNVHSTSYNALQVVSAMGLVVYTLGIPLSFFLVLVKNRAELWSPSSTVAIKYAFLYQDLNPNRWWFFPVSMLEKMCYAVIVVFLAGHVFEQYAMEVLLTLASVVALAVLRPYTGWLQILLLSSRVVIFLTVFGAIVMSHESCSNSGNAQGRRFHVNNHAVGVVLIMLNLIVVLLPLAFLVSLWRQNPQCLHCCRRQTPDISLQQFRRSLLEDDSHSDGSAAHSKHSAIAEPAAMVEPDVSE